MCTLQGFSYVRPLWRRRPGRQYLGAGILATTESAFPPNNESIGRDLDECNVSRSDVAFVQAGGQALVAQRETKDSPLPAPT